jgi:hypothetical protein
MPANFSLWIGQETYAFYASRCFIIVLTISYHWTLSLANSNHSILYLLLIHFNITLPSIHHSLSLSVTFKFTYYNLPICQHFPCVLRALPIRFRHQDQTDWLTVSRNMTLTLRATVSAGSTEGIPLWDTLTADWRQCDRWNKQFMFCNVPVSLYPLMPCGLQSFIHSFFFRFPTGT